MSTTTPFVLNGVHIDPGLNRVTRDGSECHLEPQVMKLLQFLAANADTTVDRDTLMEEVWPGSEPNEEALTQAVSKLRRALGDTDRTLIRTVRKVGYRLQGPIHQVTEREATRPDRSATPKERPVQTRRWRLAIPLASLALVAFMVSRVKVVAVHHTDPMPASWVMAADAGMPDVTLNVTHSLPDSSRVIAIRRVRR